MRIIFMGSPEYALKALKSLVQHFEIVAVFSQPPKEAGRGMKERKNPTHEYALEHNIPCYTPKSLRNPEIQETIRSYKPDVIVVAAYGLILPKEVLEIPKYGCINIHGSLLPLWRGAAPIHRAILAGDHETGITIMQMDVGLDTGPMLLKESVSIGETDTYKILYDKLSDIGAKLIVEYLLNIDHIKPITQDNALSTYAPKIKKEESYLDSSKTMIENLRIIQAFDPARLEYMGQILLIYQAEKGDIKRPTGVVEKKFYFACKDGSLVIKKIQRSGKKIMDIEEFIRGLRG